MISQVCTAVSNDECLICFQRYKEFLEAEKPGSGEKLLSTIELLANTSKFIEIFSGMTPIRSQHDTRLSELKNVLKFFDDWEADAKTATKAFGSRLMSVQCREDLKSSIIGFISMTRHHLKMYASSVIPGRVNSDIVENV